MDPHPRLKHGVRPHGGLGRRVLAMVFHQDVVGAVDVDVEDYGWAATVS